MEDITEKEKEEQLKKSKAIVQRYRERFQTLKQAQEYSAKDDVPRAVNAYLKYLDSLAAYFEVKENELKPTMFKGGNGIAEVLLVSQVYWDLAKAFDRAPNLVEDSKRCLDQFVLFSVGFKFQFVNSELLRKYIRKKTCYNIKNFEKAYEKIRVQSKKCYIATHAFGEDHHVTGTLRVFKKEILRYSWGHYFVDYYYRLSPILVNYLNESPLLNKVINPFIKFPLLLFAKFLDRFRI